MNLLLNLVVVLQIVAALVMIGLVLIQHGKGADMGASFGSGASGSLFGATGSANFLSRSTAVCAAVFFVCTLALAFFSNDRSRASTGSVLDRPAASAPAASEPATGAALIPGAASGAAAIAVPAPAATASGAGAVPAK
jgi:preprotein translocase subunit SecG